MLPTSFVDGRVYGGAGTTLASADRLLDLSESTEIDI